MPQPHFFFKCFNITAIASISPSRSSIPISLVTASFSPNLKAWLHDPSMSQRLEPLGVTKLDFSLEVMRRKGCIPSKPVKRMDRSRCPPRGHLAEPSASQLCGSFAVSYLQPCSQSQVLIVDSFSGVSKGPNAPHSCDCALSQSWGTASITALGSLLPPK